MALDAVAFDMDGLLLDSERLYQTAFREACEAQGLPFDEASYLEIICTPDAEARTILRAAYGAAFPLEAVLHAAAERYRSRVEREPVPLKPGVRALLEVLAARNIPRAVVTSTARDFARHKLRLAGLLEAFAFVVGGDDTARNKPAPEPYLLACARFGLPPERCLALEDSENGVRSALAAGLRVVQIPDLKAPSADVLRLGHAVLGSLAEVAALLGGRSPDPRAAAVNSDPTISPDIPPERSPDNA